VEIRIPGFSRKFRLAEMSINQDVKSFSLLNNDSLV
jgi:hypothetical protein